MGRFEIPDHPEIACIERTGYPSWMQEEDDDYEMQEEDNDYERDFLGDEDRLYEERRERKIFGDW
jgi:hypothetical protein